MTEAELIEKINKKRNELEEHRSGSVSSSLLRVLEEEIKDLETALASGDTEGADEQQVFLDECAG